MAILKQLSLVGTHVNAATGDEYDYEVECRVAVDTQRRESMHLRVLVFRGNASTGFVVTGHVDPDQSFLGREEDLALECVELACARVSAPCAPAPAGSRQRGHHEPPHGGRRVWPLTLDWALGRHPR